jgi:hypothetical protein
MAIVDQVGDYNEDIWETVVGLLNIIDEEVLFGSATGDEAEGAFRRCVDVAIEAVASASRGLSSLCEA